MTDLFDPSDEVSEEEGILANQLINHLPSGELGVDETLRMARVFDTPLGRALQVLTQRPGNVSYGFMGDKVYKSEDTAAGRMFTVFRDGQVVDTMIPEQRRDGAGRGAVPAVFPGAPDRRSDPEQDWREAYARSAAELLRHLPPGELSPSEQERLETMADTRRGRALQVVTGRPGNIVFGLLSGRVFKAQDTDAGRLLTFYRDGQVVDTVFPKSGRRS